MKLLLSFLFGILSVVTIGTAVPEQPQADQYPFVVVGWESQSCSLNGALHIRWVDEEGDEQTASTALRTGTLFLATVNTSISDEPTANIATYAPRPRPEARSGDPSSSRHNLRTAW